MGLLTKRYALIGEGIGYSLSTAIHNEVYKHLKINAEYSLLDIPEAEFSSAAALLWALNGFNVTKPYKLRIKEMLSESGESVNTVYQRGNTLVGCSTDGGGFDYATREQDFAGKDVLLIGAGGAAVAIIECLLRRGAVVHIYNRTPERASMLAERFNLRAYSEGLSPSVIINAATVTSTLPTPEGVSLDKTGFIFDAVYQKTALQQLASERGIPFKDGREMLVYQALLSEQIWNGIEIDDGLVNRLLALVDELLGR